MLIDALLLFPIFIGYWQNCLSFDLSNNNYFSPKLKNRNVKSKIDAENKYGKYSQYCRKISLYRSYNADEIDKYFSRRPLEVWERLVTIGSPILGWWISRRIENITSNFRSYNENQKLLNIRAADLKNSIVQSKSVTLIKSGQALALRPDIVKSPEYVRELQKLQDEVGTFDNEIAFDIMRDDLKRDPNEIFEFDPIYPIASASIGQVYRARIRDTKKLVAIKVQRPDALPSANLDMFLLRKAAAYLKKSKKLRSDMVGIADEFGRQLFCELNYIQEARNCQRFKQLYGHIPGIYVPEVYMNLTTQRVLTMEFVEGVKGPWAQGGERMLTIGLQCSVLQLLDTGFFHADPHRGNLLQTPDNKLAYLDFGMMAEMTSDRLNICTLRFRYNIFMHHSGSSQLAVPSAKRYGMIGTVLGLVNKDLDMVVSNLRDLDFFPPDTDTQVVVAALNAAVFNSTVNGRGSTLNFTQLSRNINSISYLLPVRLPPFYTLVIRTLTILEGLALYVDPDFRLIRGAYPFVAKQILTSSSPELAELLRAVIVNKNGGIRWDKLEQFVSISANADAAVAGDFEALKAAQRRSDINKVYTDTEQSGNVTAEILSQIFTFLLSDSGRVLREPLVREIADTVDSLGLTAQVLASVISSGIIPRPPVAPDKERVDRVLGLLDIVLKNIIGDNPRGSSGSGSGAPVGLSSFVKRIFENTNPSAVLAKYQPVLRGAAPILTEVAALVAERNARRLTKELFSEDNLRNYVPLIGSLALDTFSPLGTALLRESRESTKTTSSSPSSPSPTKGGGEIVSSL